MDFHLNSLLNLPNVTVFTCYKEIDFICLYLQLNNEGIHCPNCQEYIDRFHVMKLVNKSLNKIRLKLGLTGLKNKSLLMKNARDLSDEEKLERRELFIHTRDPNYSNKHYLSP